LFWLSRDIDQVVLLH